MRAQHSLYTVFFMSPAKSDREPRRMHCDKIAGTFRLQRILNKLSDWKCTGIKVRKEHGTKAYDLRTCVDRDLLGLPRNTREHTSRQRNGFVGA